MTRAAKGGQTNGRIDWGRAFPYEEGVSIAGAISTRTGFRDFFVLFTGAKPVGERFNGEVEELQLDRDAPGSAQ